MRARRVRFTTPRVRRNDVRDRAIKTLEGESSYRNSPAGRAVKMEQLAEQWRSQNHLCADCGGEMELGDCKFRHKVWDKGTVNPVVHKRCKGGSMGGGYA